MMARDSFVLLRYWQSSASLCDTFFDLSHATRYGWMPYCTYGMLLVALCDGCLLV